MCPKQNHTVLANQNGLAMILAISCIALLSMLAIWMILQSKSNIQTTKSYERTEATTRLAEAALWRVVHLLDIDTPALPTSRILNDMNSTAVTTPSYMQKTSLTEDGSFTPKIRSGRDFYNTLPLEGWMLNEPNRYFTKYYEGDGQAEKPLSGARGSARSHLRNFVEKVSR
jgi:hypothetical protein